MLCRIKKKESEKWRLPQDTQDHIKIFVSFSGGEGGKEKNEKRLEFMFRKHVSKKKKTWEKAILN